MVRVFFSCLVSAIVTVLIFNLAGFMGVGHVTALVVGIAIITIGFGNLARANHASGFAAAAFRTSSTAFAIASVGSIRNAYIATHTSYGTTFHAIGSIVVAFASICAALAIKPRITEVTTVMAADEFYRERPWTIAMFVLSILAGVCGWYWNFSWQVLVAFAATFACATMYASSRARD